MRGNAALKWKWFLGLLLCSAAVAGAQFQPNGLFVLQSQSPTSGEPLSTSAQGDVLQFVDGSILHGELKQMDVSNGLRWFTPAAKKPMDLRPTHIDSIRFAHAGSVTFAPTAHLRFATGDDVFGSINSLDNNHLGFSTWFGKTLTVPRSSVQSITFLSSNYTLLYEGPGDADGWIVGNHNPESWVLHDGTFTSGFPGTLGRDFKLTGSSTIEFDLEWTDAFELFVSIYSDSLDRVDYNSYMLQFTREDVNLRHIEAANTGPPRSLGTAPLNIPAGRSKVHITIQSNKQEGTIAVFVDNTLVKRWKDENGFSATGSGVFFQQQVISGGVIKLSNITVSQWDGRYEPETSFVATNIDVIRFINHDQVAGKIAGIDQGKISLALGDTILQIPIDRVTQINFSGADFAAVPHGPWDVRAHFPRGGSICFRLEKWTDQEVSGQSDLFGTLAFQPGQIRQLEFNLGHAKTAAPVVTDQEFESLDE